LTPLAGIVQLKSSLSHLDKADAGAKKAAAAAATNDGGGGDSTATESEGEEARPVVVKFARRESKVKGQGKGGGVGRRVNFQEFMENKKSSEAWITVNYNDIDSEEAAEERRLLFAERDDQSGIFTQTMEGYVDTICPKVVTEEATLPVAMPTGVLSLTELKSLPLAQGVDKLLRSVHMIQFSRLCSLLGVMGGGVLSVCEAVKNTAVLVQGCWVVSSQQLFPGDDNASKRNSRDYIVSTCMFIQLYT
jgi:DNA-directed RNA polymerase-3 subunit RPC5